MKVKDLSSKLNNNLGGTSMSGFSEMGGGGM
jgi:hypothetical protein